MPDQVYTLGVWVVKSGLQEEFISAWLGLGAYFHQLESPPGLGTLIQSVSDDTQFYSFGPWASIEAIEAMRGRPETAVQIGKLMALCDEGRPGAFRVVATV